MRTAFACAAVVLASVFTAGCGDDGSDETAPPATTTSASAAPASTLPTSESVKVAIFERAYSECASTELPALAAKYKLKSTKSEVLATGVALAWIKYFEGGQDAFSDGRDGCLAGLKDRNK